ncbi:MAG: hypothetical protein H8F28_07975 [Fibrella sp.]|nr:hypothetical protein [Armatimonadota bacterium]
MSIVLELGEIEQDARQAAAAAGMDLSDFMREAVRAKVRENNFATARPFENWTDGDLVSAIKIGYPPGFRQRYRELRKKREEGALTKEEKDELIRCSDRVMHRDTERLPLLFELALRRKTDAPSLIHQLQLRRQVA